MLRHVVGAVLAVLITAGCTASAPAQTAQTPAAAPTSAAPKNGCDSPTLKAGAHTLSFGGQQRRYLLALPEGKGPHPLVLNLHGMGSNAAQQAAYSRLPDLGPGRGYVVVTPQSAPGTIGWGLPDMFGPDDVGFLDALLDDLGERLCLDTGRQFAAGMSLGAGMSVALVCGLKGRLAAVAPVAGINIVPPCKQAKPTAIIAFHGTADAIVPYKGGHPFRDKTGRLRALGELVVLQPVEEVVDGWADILGCSGRTTSNPSKDVRLRTWKGCRLSLYTIKDGGHTWPGAMAVARLGATASLDASALILDAFDKAPPRR